MIGPSAWLTPGGHRRGRDGRERPGLGVGTYPRSTPSSSSSSTGGKMLQMPSRFNPASTHNQTVTVGSTRFRNQFGLQMGLPLSVQPRTAE